MVSKHQYIYIYILKLKHIKPTKASNMINKGLITLLGQKQGTLIVFQKKKLVQKKIKTKETI